MLLPGFGFQQGKIGTEEWLGRTVVSVVCMFLRTGWASKAGGRCGRADKNSDRRHGQEQVFFSHRYIFPEMPEANGETFGRVGAVPIVFELARLRSMAHLVKKGTAPAVWKLSK